MNTLRPLKKAIEICGGQTALGRRIGNVQQSRIGNWLMRGQVPAKMVIAVERATDGQVTRYELRPDIFGPPPSDQAAA